MRDMRLVSADEFQAFLGARPDLTMQRVGPMFCYVEAGEWPDNLMASYCPAGPTRRRDGGWRIAVQDVAKEEPTDDAQAV